MAAARGAQMMNASFLDAVDWQRPWLLPFRATVEPLLRAADMHAAFNTLADASGLLNHRGLPIRFVAQSALPPRTAYESFISATGNVPTRENLHDFFNALVWLSYPKIKAQLNALQAAEIEKAGAMPPQGSRGQVRDAATLFDENAALLIVRDAEWIAEFRAHRWRGLFIERRAQFKRDCEVSLFGHALMEKLVAPYKAITAHAWPIIADDAYFDLAPADRPRWLDDAVARRLAEGLILADFTPLPVLGVPGWWSEQGEPFYADASVFRPARQAR